MGTDRGVEANKGMGAIGTWEQLAGMKMPCL